jgi:hypothetical protein
MNARLEWVRAALDGPEDPGGQSLRTRLEVNDLDLEAVLILDLLDILNELDEKG